MLTEPFEVQEHSPRFFLSQSETSRAEPIRFFLKDLFFRPLKKMKKNVFEVCLFRLKEASKTYRHTAKFQANFWAEKLSKSFLEGALLGWKKGGRTFAKLRFLNVQAEKAGIFILFFSTRWKKEYRYKHFFDFVRPHATNPKKSSAAGIELNCFKRVFLWIILKRSFSGPPTFFMKSHYDLKKTDKFSLPTFFIYKNIYLFYFTSSFSRFLYDLKTCKNTLFIKTSYIAVISKQAFSLFRFGSRAKGGSCLAWSWRSKNCFTLLNELLHRLKACKNKSFFKTCYIP